MIEPLLLIAGGALLIVWVLMGRRKPEPEPESGFAMRIEFRESLSVLRGRDLL